MRRNGRQWILGALCVAALGSVIGGCGGAGEQSVEATGRTPVVLADVEHEMVSPSVRYSGTVEAGRKALLGAEIQGQVERIHVEAGDRVNAGDLLAELAGEQLTQARAQAEAAEKDWERARDLLDKGAVTQQAYDHATAAVEIARASYEMVRASSELRAPFAGVITERYLDEGEVYTLMSMSAGSPALFELADISDVKVVFEAGERERALIEKGLEAEVTVDSRPGKVFHGVVSRVDPSLNLMSRTATVEVTVANPGSQLMPGSFADLRITLKSRDAVVVPRDALVRQEGTGVFFVYAVEEGVARRKVVELGDGFGASVEILNGLEGGEQVVTDGRYKLYDGAEVVPRTEAAGSGTQGGAGSGDPEDAGSQSAGKEGTR